MQIFREQGKRRETNKRIIIFVAIVNLSSAQIIAIFSTIHKLDKFFSLFFVRCENSEKFANESSSPEIKGKIKGR